jgi:hypothetical protein
VFRPIFHIALHLFVPGIVARLGWKKNWKQAWFVMIATLIVDLDHLLSDPIYDPNRCSIGTHPLHTSSAIVLYFGLSIYPRTRLIGLGLIIHMLLDGIDCAWMMWT